MREADLRDYSSFLREFQDESDRGAALVGAAWIDEKLLQILQSFMLDCKVTQELVIGGMSPLGAFSARAKAAFALGLISEYELHEIDTVRKVRNEFAHRTHGTTFADPKITALCKKFTSGTPGPIDDPRSLFINAVVCTQMSLYYRDEYIAINSRVTPEWAAKEHKASQRKRV